MLRDAIADSTQQNQVEKQLTGFGKACLFLLNILHAAHSTSEEQAFRIRPGCATGHFSQEKQPVRIRTGCMLASGSTSVDLNRRTHVGGSLPLGSLCEDQSVWKVCMHMQNSMMLKPDAYLLIEGAVCCYCILLHCDLPVYIVHCSVNRKGNY